MKTTSKNLCVAALFAILLGVIAVEGWAQSGGKGFGSTSVDRLIRNNSASRFSVGNVQRTLRNRSAAIVGTPGVNQRNFLGASSGLLSQRAKPFNSVTRGPTVSPYLALSAPRAAASDYQRIIRPQQQQQRENQRQQAFAIQRQRQLNKTAARAPYSTTGDENRAPTGHAAVFQSLGSFQNTGRYFPPPSPPKRR